MRSTSLLNQNTFQSLLTQMTQIKTNLASLLQTADQDSKKEDAELSTLNSYLTQMKESLTGLSRIGMDLAQSDAHTEERDASDPNSKKEKIFTVNRDRIAYRLEQANISILVLKLFNQCHLKYNKLTDEGKETIFKKMVTVLFPFPDQFMDYLLSSALVLDLADYSKGELGDFPSEKLEQLTSLSGQLAQLVKVDGDFLKEIEVAHKNLEEIRANKPKAKAAEVKEGESYAGSSAPLFSPKAASPSDDASGSLEKGPRFF